MSQLSVTLVFGSLSILHMSTIAKLSICFADSETQAPVVHVTLQTLVGLRVIAAGFCRLVVVVEQVSQSSVLRGTHVYGTGSQ